MNEVAGTGPLDGLRVVEVGTRRAGSFAGAILADLGADVVKVEQHVAADVPPDGPEAADRIAFDRNKRSVAVDLGRPGGLDVIARLVARSDVLLDELRPAELSGLELGGPAGAPAGDRRLVHCSITPFGPAPPAPVPAMHPGCEDLLIQALSGNMDLTGEAGGPRSSWGSRRRPGPGRPPPRGFGPRRRRGPLAQDDHLCTEHDRYRDPRLGRPGCLREMTASGTHSLEFAGVKPTGKYIKWEAIALYIFDAEEPGKLLAERAYWDNDALIKQMRGEESPPLLGLAENPRILEQNSVKSVHKSS